jgi:hypothetical protein
MVGLGRCSPILKLAHSNLFSLVPDMPNIENGQY